MKFWIIIFLCLILVINAIEEDSARVKVSRANIHSPDRTSFHFQPPKNWMNDPNGPMYYKGVYHFFYQYNPYAAVFNLTIVWGHAVSYDLINWLHLKFALTPDKSYDLSSCFTGSITFLDNGKPVILYTGLDNKKRQVTNLAMPKNSADTFLHEWVKYSGNPIMTPPDGVKPDEFRDPSTAWKGKDGNWRVLVGGLKNNQGNIFLYRSRDFMNWTKFERSFYSGTNPQTWECPDFYPVLLNSKNGVDNSVTGRNLKYVLKASFKAHEYYTIGSYDPGQEKYVSDLTGSFGEISSLRYDYGKFYASKTFYDAAKNRRVLWGWITESDSSNDDINKGWAGIQSIPRRIFLSDDQKQLIQWPIEEIESLRSKHISFQNRILKANSVYEVPGITASQADVEILFKLPKLEEAAVVNLRGVDPQQLCSTGSAGIVSRIGPFGLLAFASKDLKEQTAIFFNIFKEQTNLKVLMCSDQSRSSLKGGLDKTTYGAFLDIDPHQETLSLRSLIDHSVIESYAEKGKACISARVYPTIAINERSHLFVFNAGAFNVIISQLDAWSMNPARFSDRTNG